jgi:hypothetical protein
MSGRLAISFVDFPAVSSAFDRVCCVSVRSFSGAKPVRLPVRGSDMGDRRRTSLSLAFRSRLIPTSLEGVGLSHCNSILAGLDGSIPVALIANQLLEFSCAFIAAVSPWPALHFGANLWIKRGNVARAAISRNREI